MSAPRRMTAGYVLCGSAGWSRQGHQACETSAAAGLRNGAPGPRCGLGGGGGIRYQALVEDVGQQPWCISWTTWISPGTCRFPTWAMAIAVRVAYECVDAASVAGSFPGEQDHTQRRAGWDRDDTARSSANRGTARMVEDLSR